MSAFTTPRARPSEEAFRHEALLYGDQDELLQGTVPFIEGPLAADEPILVALRQHQIDLLRAELGGDADMVQFADMLELGSNPARIIPAWRDFVDERSSPSARVWGIGEPIWADRSAAELVECQRHESLLNVAFAHTREFVLLCRYDTQTLDRSVIEEAERSHPVVLENGVERRRNACRSVEAAAAPFVEPLPEPRGRPRELVFDGGSLDRVRGFVHRQAGAVGIGPERTDEVVLAVNELATNSVRHAGGHGTLRCWAEADTLICEVRDDGRIEQPLVGRERPGSGQVGGMGLWLVNHLCDLVQVRSFATGNVVRAHVRRR